MDRLETVLKEAQAAEGSGVVSQRKCTSRLIPPADDQPNYTAEVTISTVVSVDPADVTAPANGTPPRKSTDNAATDEASAAGLISDEAAKPLFKNEVYTLVYENDRWRLTEEPEGPIARTCFEYALSE